MQRRRGLGGTFGSGRKTCLSLHRFPGPWEQGLRPSTALANLLYLELETEARVSGMLDRYRPLSYTFGLLFIGNYDVWKVNTCVVQSNTQALLKSTWIRKEKERERKRRANKQELSNQPLQTSKWHIHLTQKDLCRRWPLHHFDMY